MAGLIWPQMGPGGKWELRWAGEEERRRVGQPSCPEKTSSAKNMETQNCCSGRHRACLTPAQGACPPES